MEILLPHGGKAASVQHVLRDVLQQVVEERADLGGVKGRRAAGLGLQTVLHEVGEVAAPQPLHPGGGHGDPLPVQRLYSAAGQAAPLQCRRPLHGRQRGGVVGGSRKIPPQGPIRDSSGGLQRRDRCCQAIILVIFFAFYPHGREQRPQPVHHEGRPQLRPGHVR